jgi:ribosomal protein S18 acetylase RimI-like enzyme
MAMWVMHLSARARKTFRAFIANVQRTSLYRLASSHKRHGVEIVEASDVDLAKVHSAFDLEVDPSSTDDHDTVNYVAKKGAVVVGFAQLVRPSDGETLDNGYYLFSLNVRPFYRGLGIGQDLTRKVMARAKADGARELSVITKEDNRTALGLFHKLGFRVRRTQASNEKGEKKTPSQRRKKLILAKTLVD